MQVAAVNRNLNATTTAQLAGDVSPDWAETGTWRHGMYEVQAAGFQDTYSLLKSNKPPPETGNGVQVHHVTVLFHPTKH
jgi:hypothetical protein